MSTHTLIVGAGLAGMTAAHRLTEVGPADSRITVLDKGRRAGGRMATRVSRRGPVFDHGAQYLTAKSVTFNQQVHRWIDARVAAAWNGRIVDLQEGQTPADTRRVAKRFVGTPAMNSIIEHLCDEVSGDPRIDGPHFGIRVTQLQQAGAGWNALDEAGQTHGPFGRVVLAIPMPQAQQLLAEPAPGLAAKVGEAGVSATWTLMLAFAKPLELWQEFAGAFVEDSIPELSWIANNSSKPGRPSVADVGACWTIHASPEWSDAHVEDAPESVAATLTAAFGRALGRTLPSPTYAAVHRWRFAHAVEPLNDRWLFDETLNLAVCGDACTAGSPANIERAWLSGLGLAEHLAVS